MEKTLIHRSDRIIITTVDIIDELGIQGLTTKEIARRQEMSEATLFRHFKSKNELLLSVLDYYSKFDSDIFLSIKMKSLKPKEAIIYFVESFVTYYENYPAITAITQAFDIMRYDAELEDKIKDIFVKRMDVMKSLIDTAKEAKIINMNTNSETLADIIISTCNGICLKWRIYKQSFSLSNKTLYAVNMLLDSFSM